MTATKAIIPLCLALLLLPGTAQQQRAIPQEATDAKKAIRQVLDDQVVAWNKGDLPGFMEGYWQSPDLRFYSGKDVTSGWQATLDRYRKRYQGEGKKMGQLVVQRGANRAARRRARPGSRPLASGAAGPNAQRPVHAHLQEADARLAHRARSHVIVNQTSTRGTGFLARPDGPGRPSHVVVAIQS